MYNHFIINITILLLLTGCAPKSLAPQVFRDGARFFFHAPYARSVSISGSFNRWDQGRDHLTGPDKKGIWTITLPLSTGRHEYQFVINNRERVLDPAAPTIDDGLDGKNSFVLIPP